MNKTKIMRRIMLFWCFFIGVGAVFGAVGMLVAPDGSALGMQGLLPFFQVLPFSEQLFQNYIFPGISLLVVNGITNLVAAMLLLFHKKAGALLGCIFGITLMLWITIQFIIFPMNFMSTIYFVFGALQFLCGILYIIFLKQAEFAFCPEDYNNVGTNKRALVVYFSRLSYTKKIAYEQAQKTGACVYEVTTPERTDDFAGFLWCGRFGMHKWGMPIDPISVELASFEEVTIVTPIWVFTICAPIREFCKKVSGQIQKASYIVVHFRKDSTFQKAFDEMDTLLGLKREHAQSVVCKFGRVQKTVDFS